MALDLGLPIRFLPEFLDSPDVIPNRKVSFCSYGSEDLDGHKVAWVTMNRPRLINGAKAARTDMFEQLIISEPICIRIRQSLLCR